MPVAAIGRRHGAAMGAVEELRGGPTWGQAGGAAAAGSGGFDARWWAGAPQFGSSARLADFRRVETSAQGVKLKNCGAANSGIQHDTHMQTQSLE